jgi:hypothetical protein
VEGRCICCVADNGLDDMVQRDLDNGHTMMDSCRAGALSGIMVASTIETTKIMRISVLKMA